MPVSTLSKPFADPRDHLEVTARVPEAEFQSPTLNWYELVPFDFSTNSRITKSLQNDICAGPAGATWDDAGRSGLSVAQRVCLKTSRSLPHLPSHYSVEKKL